MMKDESRAIDTADEPVEESREDQTLAGWAEDAASGREESTHRGFPRLPERVENISPQQSVDALVLVRRFHRGDPRSGDKLRTIDKDVIPALLFPFSEPGAIRHDYPLMLLPRAGEVDDELILPIADLLTRLVDDFAPGDDDARTLKDNLPRLEQTIRALTSDKGSPEPAGDIIRRATDEVMRSLALSGPTGQQLRSELDKLVSALPDDGLLLGLGPMTPVYLYLHAAKHHAAHYRRVLRDKCGLLRKKLHDLMLTDLDKEPEGREPDVLAPTVGAAGMNLVDPAQLAKILGPSRGAEPMSEARRKRVANAIKVFEAFVAEEDRALAIAVHHEKVAPELMTEAVDWRLVDLNQVCSTASDIFDEVAAKYARIFAAIRVADLELADAYEEDRHDPLLASFDWEAFNRDELLSLPPIVAVETAEHLAGDGMLAMSRLQLSGRPASVLIIVHPCMNPGVPADQDQLHGWRFEMAYRGISHRESIVSQSTTARPDHLMTGYLRSLRSTRSSMHVVASGFGIDQQVPPLGSWLHAGAAMEGRAHPLFVYDPGRGESWAKRFDLMINPQVEEDWPTYSLPCVESNGEPGSLKLAFTFADFALLEERYREHFRIIPSVCYSSQLVTVAEYFKLDNDDMMSHVPYIWATDSTGKLKRLVISRRLAFACRDRLGYWHTIQELAGIGNEHVIAAVREERAKLEEQFEAEREQMRAEHAAELEQVRLEEATQVLKRLAGSLLDADASSFTTSAAPRAAAPAPAAPAEVDEPVEAEPAAEVDAAPVEAVDDGPEEPWIDSILCTSCNDCININRQMFVYNGSKQATIGDPTAGTFAQLVQAAEKCPSRCIHPGKPLNPDEPNLDELIQRAAKFN
jgi:ferredoxin